MELPQIELQSSYFKPAFPRKIHMVSTSHVNLSHSSEFPDLLFDELGYEQKMILTLGARKII